MKGGNQTIIDWCLANGATSTQYATALIEAAQAAGATAADVNTAVQEMLVAAGYTGSLADMWEQFLAAGMPPVGGAGYTATMNVGSFSSIRGYDAVTYMIGSLSETTFDDMTITRWYVVGDSVYIYTTPADNTGESLSVTMGTFGTPITVNGGATYWSSAVITGLSTYMNGVAGTDIEVTIERLV